MDLIAYTDEIYSICKGLEAEKAPQAIIDTFNRLIQNTALQSTRQTIRDKCIADIQLLQEYAAMKSESDPYKTIIFLCYIIRQTSGYPTTE